MENSPFLPRQSLLNQQFKLNWTIGRTGRDPWVVFLEPSLTLLNERYTKDYLDWNHKRTIFGSLKHLSVDRSRNHFCTYDMCVKKLMCVNQPNMNMNMNHIIIAVHCTYPLARIHLYISDYAFLYICQSLR